MFKRIITNSGVIYYRKMKKQLLFLQLVLQSIFVIAQEAYYNDVNLNLSGVSLKNALATKITTTHTNFLTYTPDVWEASRATDVNPSNSNEVLLIYGYSASGITSRTRDINNNGGGNGQWNREHVYPRSLGTPNLGDSGPGSDAHSLRPSDVQTNSSRGNKQFADGSGNSGAVTNGWYPGDEWKGDVARMMMYMYLRYDSRCLPSNVGVGNNSGTPDDMIDLFLEWNVEDPVSDFEKQRNSYHENTNNTYAQGNRNPFIDNPYLATRIWGGQDAEDTWGIYTGSDTEAPTVPMNVTLTNVTTSSIDITWNASTDNVGVSSYEVYINGNFTVETSNTNYDATGLNPNTNYSFTVLAKDIAENESALSTPVNSTTLEDTEAPTVPTNVVISNETNASFKITWNASTDNTAVVDYDVFLDGNLNNSTTNTTLTVNGLQSSTTYSVTIVANDISDNQSAASTPVNATTSGSGSGSSNEIFFSEYIEGSFGFNKALEIVNLTGSSVDLSPYSIKRQRNGGQDGDDWSTGDGILNLSGTLANGDVFVIIHEDATIQKLIDEADLVRVNNSTTQNGTPVNFNGNDPVGLFKNDVLIDIIGTYNSGSGNFAKDVTLRRKFSVTSPNIIFDEVNEWDEYDQDNVEDFGQHSSTLSNDELSLESIKFYPNPISDVMYFRGIKEKTNIQIYSILGSKVFSTDIDNTTKNVNISNLKAGIYLIRFISKGKSVTKKFVKSN